MPRIAAGTSFLSRRVAQPLRAAIPHPQPEKAVLTTETSTGTISRADSTLEDDIPEHVDPSMYVAAGVLNNKANDASGILGDTVLIFYNEDAQAKTGPTSLTDHPDEDLFDDMQDRSSSGSSLRLSSLENPDPDAVTEDLRAD
jgi:hypothetical protein